MATRVGIWFEIQISFHFAVRQRRARSCRNTHTLRRCRCPVVHLDTALSDLIASACCATLMGTNEIKFFFFQFPPFLFLHFFSASCLCFRLSSFLILFSFILFASVCFYISLFLPFCIFIPFTSSDLSNGYRELFIWGKLAGAWSCPLTSI
jgi:hypothetical protein